LSTRHRDQPQRQHRKQRDQEQALAVRAVALRNAAARLLTGWGSITGRPRLCRLEGRRQKADI